ncbi:hypothetical protein GCM10023346_03940 [Arthrobacter gyeryongensis]|uniref:Transposase n=1 Tax=Arthrobacter gyeryongensis TaxID=1650592 RepID=A0ABP9S0T8_9MICC
MKTDRRFVVERWECTQGLTVSVYRKGSHIRTGTVDMAAPTGECVWIASDPYEGRTLIHRSEGYILTVDEQQSAFLNGLT